MSYILDALRKAEAQRARGAIPGLHAPSLAIPVPDAGTSGRRRVAAWAALGVLVPAVAVVAGWKLGQRDEPPVASAPAPTVAEAPTAAPAVALATPTGPFRPPNMAPPATPPRQATPRVAQRVEPNLARSNLRNDSRGDSPSDTQTHTQQIAASPGGAPRLTAQAVPGGALPGASSVAERAPLGEPRIPPRTPAAQGDRIPSFSELPQATQQSMPKLAVGGSIYSDDPAARFLIVNGETFHQGEHLAPELVLEQIRAKEAVLAFKGQRFRLAL